MITTYFTDIINIIPVTYDLNGVETEGTAVPVDARVEDKQKMIMGSNGKEVFGQSYIMIAADAVIDYTSKIQIVSQNGIASEDPTKKYPVLNLSRGHGLCEMYRGVWI